jgi:hypothetical protein
MFHESAVLLFTKAIGKFFYESDIPERFEDREYNVRLGAYGEEGHGCVGG